MEQVGHKDIILQDSTYTRCRESSSQRHKLNGGARGCGQAERGLPAGSASVGKSEEHPEGGGDSCATTPARLTPLARALKTGKMARFMLYVFHNFQKLRKKGTAWTQRLY